MASIPLKNNYELVGIIIPNIWKNKNNLPNNQPTMVFAPKIQRLMGLAPHCATRRRVDATQPHGDGQGFLAEHRVEVPWYSYMAIYSL